MIKKYHNHKAANNCFHIRLADFCLMTNRNDHSNRGPESVWLEYSYISYLDPNRKNNHMKPLLSDRKWQNTKYLK